MKMINMRSRMKNRQLLKAAACGIALVGLLVGCSEEKQEAEEKGVVERASDAVAHKAAEQLNKPLDKAKDSQALQNMQNQQMEKMTEEAQQ
ncbi:MAG: hypothetical protein ACTFAL_09585 [Candidatus Electronema sp. V4]|uniref:hypothetical protein n=1 Tax=Candidatus Electronema sp. V4 TaxID=3454756 RepID=UPI00405575BF